ncbi:type 4 fimbrial biogenesis protein PilF [Endozoicomonas montiporae CL-33]|uniref:Type 4 fimbrial biogenesis protein PilF n=2 Tax=Endozoicomonas montiporae TaxID=1027273 RepID=A0A142BBA8_9GAMM|nr:type 4 fimbrial biogenesis protein PilF [Endozoicomonas montiporae CL-33]
MCAMLAVVLTGCVSTGGRQTDENQAVRSYIDLARGYVQEGYTENAIKPLNRALEIQPGSSDVHAMFALVYQLQGENRLAEQSFRKALSLSSGSSEIHNNYGAFLFSQNRLSEAYRQFTLAGDDVRYPQRSRVFENMGLVALQQGQRDRARQNFEKSLKLNANLPRARLELASLFYEQGQYPLAWEHYQTFVTMSSQNERSLQLGIRLARANGDNSAAARYADELQRYYPNSKAGWDSRSRSSYDY